MTRNETYYYFIPQDASTCSIFGSFHDNIISYQLSFGRNLHGEKMMTKKVSEITALSHEKLRYSDEVIFESDLNITKRILREKNTCIQEFKAFKTVIVDRKTYFSLEYNRLQKSFASLVKLRDNCLGFVHAIYVEGTRQNSNTRHTRECSRILVRKNLKCR
jgi:hypothetical protein